MFECMANPDLFKGYKIKIYPTEEQKVFLNRQIELFRYVYNWALGKEEEQYTLYKNGLVKKSFLEVLDLYTLFRDERKEKPWLCEIPTHTAKEAIRNMIRGYKKFFKKASGRPKFKTKKNAKKSFQVRNEPNAFYFDGEYLRISGLKFGDKILCKNHNIPKEGVRYYRCTITFDGFNYWLSLNVERDDSRLIEQRDDVDDTYQDESIGIDIGFRKLAQLSTGQTYYHPDIHVLERRKRLQQSRLAKMRNRRIKAALKAKTKLEEIPISKNEEKLQYQYYKTRSRINNIHYSNYHKITTEIANLYPKRIVLEDINWRNLRRRKNGARSNIKWTPIHLFKEFLTYKCKDRGIEVVLADKFFPSTKKCSNCGNKYNIGSSETYKCPICGFIIDRDLNAAINLSRYGDNL